MLLDVLDTMPVAAAPPWFMPAMAVVLRPIYRRFDAIDRRFDAIDRQLVIVSPLILNYNN